MLLCAIVGFQVFSPKLSNKAIIFFVFIEEILRNLQSLVVCSWLILSKIYLYPSLRLVVSYSTRDLIEMTDRVSTVGLDVCFIYPHFLVKDWELIINLVLIDLVWTKLAEIKMRITLFNCSAVIRATMS